MYFLTNINVYNLKLLYENITHRISYLIVVLFFELTSSDLQVFNINNIEFHILLLRVF